MASIEKAFYEELLDIEGGWSDLKHDPGGLTRYGISSKNHPNVNLYTLTIEGALEIYRNEYWNPSGCDRIEDQELAEEVFKKAVHSGVSNSVKLLQEVLQVFFPELKIDGKFGPKTQKAVDDFMHTGGLFSKFLPMFLRWGFEIRIIKDYARMKNFKNFSRGWINRVLEY